MTEEEIEAEERAKKANIVSNQEFNILTKRVETMEQSIGNIVEKVKLKVSNYFHLFLTK
jgi:hypothetical protein